MQCANASLLTTVGFVVLIEISEGGLHTRLASCVYFRCRRKRTRRAEAYIEIFPVRTSTRCNFHQRPDRYQLLQPEARDPTLTVVVYILPEPALQNFPALSLLPAPLLSSSLHCFLSRLSPINNTHTSLQAPNRCLNQSQQQSRFMILRRSSPMGRYSTLRI